MPEKLAHITYFLYVCRMNALNPAERIWIRFFYRFSLYILSLGGIILLSGWNFPVPGSVRISEIPMDSLVVVASATPSSICQGSPSQLEAEVTGGMGPYTYSWTPGTDLTDSTIYNPVATPFSSTWFHVTVTDAWQVTAEDSILVTVETAPATPGMINGPSVVCENGITVYNISSIPGATTYSWTVPAGASITDGQNTPVITVQWGTTSGNVSVIAGNACGTSNPGVLWVTLYAWPPVPGPIAGPGKMCSGTTGIFSVEEQAGIQNFIWGVPPGSSILSGQGTFLVEVLWGAQSGDISVFSQNPCGNSASRTKPVTADSIPAQAGSITGNDTVCKNHSGYPFSIDPIPDADSYQWVPPSGATVSSGQGTPGITVDFGPDATSGDLVVSGINSCGSGPEKTKYLFVSDCSGMEQNHTSSFFGISPNPSSGQLNVIIRSRQFTASLEVLSVTGNTLCREQLEIHSGEISKDLDLSALPGGIYLIRLISAGEILVRKIVLY